MTYKLLNKILGNTIVSLTRVGLQEDGVPTMLMDTLLFTLADGRKFELLTEQADTCFKEVSTLKEHLGLFASFELEPDEVLVEMCELNEETTIRLPITVKHISEIWANEGEDKFLVAIILSDPAGQPALSICTESDEIELLSFDALQHRIKYTMRFYYQHIEYNKYSQKRSRHASVPQKHSPFDIMPKDTQWTIRPAVYVDPVAVAHP